MAILIDPPAWPAHDTLWSHLVSDSDYDELHAFAARLGVPRRGFDLDHYDVPAALYARAIELGARAVSAKEVVHGLRNAGLRVRGVDRDAMRAVRRRQYLVAEWHGLGAGLGVTLGEGGDAWEQLGESLIARWNESHRRYHNEQHLEDVLLALNQLSVRGENVPSETLLAAWFHDAVYAGTGTDELNSARLAVSSLTALGLTAARSTRVAEFIVATTPARAVEDPPPPLAQLLDADLAIFAAAPDRYAAYTTAVRAEYPHVTDPDFARGRATILDAYLAQPKIYRTTSAVTLWEARAQHNLHRELATLRL